MAELWEHGGAENFPTFGQAFRVPDEFTQHFETLFAAFPDVQWDIVSIATETDLVVVRSKMHGTHLGPYQGIGATGKTFAIDTIDFLQIRNGKIIHNDVLFDALTVLRQLGVLPPSGSRRERALQVAFNVLTAAKAWVRKVLGLSRSA